MGTATAQNIQVDDVPLNNSKYPDKTIRFKNIPTLGPTEEDWLEAEYTSFGDGEAQNRSGIYDDPAVIQFLNNAEYMLTAHFTDIHGRAYSQTLAMDAGRFTPSPTRARS